mmetsp:Transcript_11163/g.20635  ORF Transcript_11163/g.20635 Transcript_11163/m.20635 type:complete len:309 (-) Transcript_11163:536-1462(-)
MGFMKRNREYSSAILSRIRLLMAVAAAILFVISLYQLTSAESFGQESSIGDSAKASSLSALDQVYQIAYERTRLANERNLAKERKPLDVATWDRRTDGGLIDADRKLLGQIYFEANSVMEYGLGESTYIAAAVGVPRYVGIDSDAEWVAKARDAAPIHFQFYLGDIGPTREWGFPTHPKLAKSVLQYELAPLWMEAKAFDVYFIDGRWRPATVLLSFLHASARGGDPKKTRVGIHDYGGRPQYHLLADILLQLEFPDIKGARAVFFKRRPETTDEDILKMWFHYDRVCRAELPDSAVNKVNKLRNLGC